MTLYESARYLLLLIPIGLLAWIALWLGDLLEAAY